MTSKPDPQWHRDQIKEYSKAIPFWKRYATAMKRVLEKACRRAIPGAVVTAREKSLPSFAEKCLRKWDPKKPADEQKHRNPATSFTDLCGARVIVHTLDQVESVCAFIECNFTIVERDNKTAALAEDKFGYRDMHFLVRPRADRDWPGGFKRSEKAEIGARVAEVQVRTLVQHAWADILHDRIYKSPLKLSKEAKRTGALLAAIMEEGDRDFDRLACELDGMATNYTAYATREHVLAEIETEELILKGMMKPGTKPEVLVPGALRLARLRAPLGLYREIAGLLDPLSDAESPLKMEVRLELGRALCHVHLANVKSDGFERGRRLIEEFVAHCDSQDFTEVPDLGRRRAMKARALARLAWAWDAAGDPAKARDCHRDALDSEPGNPYFLANQLTFEIFCNPSALAAGAQGPQIREAIQKCRAHAGAGTELPFAHFTAGRLSLLADDATGALGWYARGLRHLLDEKSCVSESVLDEELKWIGRMHHGEHPPEKCEWVLRLVSLARAFHARRGEHCDTAAKRTLIVAGGAASLPPDVLPRVRPLVETALRHFSGTVISGGTTVGIPGCVGEIAAKLKAENKRNFTAIGYIPRLLPGDAPKDLRYDKWVSAGDNFSPAQILTMWENFLHDGIRPACVQLLGLGGGRLAAVEYRVALALGASVAAIHCTGGAADEILDDAAWRTTPLLGLPHDAASVRAFVTVPERTAGSGTVETMARAFHEHYREVATSGSAESMRPWSGLDETYKNANRAQAAWAAEILRTVDLHVRASASKANAILDFGPKKFQGIVERMAELEHGRWNVERLRDGWRFGRPRDNDHKLHDSLVPWSELPPQVRDLDRKSILAYPAIFAKAGLKIFRR